jgi:hypothetical protein
MAMLRQLTNFGVADNSGVDQLGRHSSLSKVLRDIQREIHSLTAMHDSLPGVSKRCSRKSSFRGKNQGFSQFSEVDTNDTPGRDEGTHQKRRCVILTAPGDREQNHCRKVLTPQVSADAEVSRLNQINAGRVARIFIATVG